MTENTAKTRVDSAKAKMAEHTERRKAEAAAAAEEAKAVAEAEAEEQKVLNEALREFRKTGHVPVGFAYRAGKMRFIG